MSKYGISEQDADYIESQILRYGILVGKARLMVHNGYAEKDIDEIYREMLATGWTPEKGYTHG